MLFKRQMQAHTPSSDRRYEILEAALRVIGDGGPDAVTFRRVATSAKAPLSSLTYYFASRDQLIRDAFRLYISEATAFMSELETERRPHTAAGVVEFVLEVARREFAVNPAIVPIEYELILYARRDPEIARDFNAYERWMEARLAASLEVLGAQRPVDAARTIIDVVRGFEIEWLTHPEAEFQDLERRLRLIVHALISERPANAASGRNQPRRVRESKPTRRSLS